jgi:hypothetical protein
MRGSVLRLVAVACAAACVCAAADSNGWLLHPNTDDFMVRARVAVGFVSRLE